MALTINYVANLGAAVSPLAAVSGTTAQDAGVRLVKYTVASSSGGTITAGRLGLKNISFAGGDDTDLTFGENSLTTSNTNGTYCTTVAGQPT